MGSCHPGGWGDGRKGPAEPSPTNQRRTRCSSLLKANSFLLLLSCGGVEEAPALFLINKSPSCRAQEARVPEETGPGESETAKTEDWLFLESSGTEKLWATGSSCRPLYLRIVLPLHLYQRAEMPLSPSTIPPLIYFTNPVDFFFHKVG